MNYYGDALSRLIEELARLPGIGARSAQRLAFYVLNMTDERANGLAQAIINAKAKVKYCEVCQNLTEMDTCVICQNPKRDQNTIMVVESPKEMSAYERTGEFHGVYHVLHGAISPMSGVGPNDIKMKELIGRVEAIGDNLAEVIVATNPNVEGEATALYISRLLKPLGVKVSRIAHGVPMGSDLEHVDEATLSMALRGRRDL